MFAYCLRKGGIRHILTLSTSQFRLENTLQTRLTTESLPPKEEIIDMSNKKYECMKISGFTVHYEAGLFESNVAFCNSLQKDLEKVN